MFGKQLCAGPVETLGPREDPGLMACPFHTEPTLQMTLMTALSWEEDLYLIFFKIILFVYFWLHWVFPAACSFL